MTVDGYPEVISSEGKSGVFAKIMENTGKKCLIVADGAAFGSEIDRVMKQITDNDDIILFLPESFEWLLLKSGLIDGNRVQDILQSPELYIRSEDYFSWERYFTALLIEETKDTYMQYSKRKLNPVYLHALEKKSILKAMEKAGELFDQNQSKTAL